MGVLAADAACHVYWLTGARWPFPDEHALSLAVLGLPAPFTARVLIPLVVLLTAAATAVWWRLRRGPGRLAHLITLGVAAAAAVQVPVRVAWTLGLGGRTAGPAFHWLNPLLYLPLCALLALAAYRVARSPAPGPS